MVAQGTLLAIFSVALMFYIDQVTGKGSPGVNLIWGVGLMSQIASVMLAIFLPLICNLADAFGRPIPAEHMKWIHRPAVIVTGALMAQGIILLFYLVLQACWL